jgi:hypothetical protein
VGPRGNFPQTAGIYTANCNLSFMGTYVTFYSTRKGQWTTQVQVAKLPSIKINPNSTKKQRVKQIVRNYHTILEKL